MQEVSDIMGELETTVMRQAQLKSEPTTLNASGSNVADLGFQLKSSASGGFQTPANKDHHESQPSSKVGSISDLSASVHSRIAPSPARPNVVHHH